MVVSCPTLGKKGNFLYLWYQRIGVWNLHPACVIPILGMSNMRHGKFHWHVKYSSLCQLSFPCMGQEMLLHLPFPGVHDTHKILSPILNLPLTGQGNPIYMPLPFPGVHDTQRFCHLSLTCTGQREILYTCPYHFLVCMILSPILNLHRPRKCYLHLPFPGVTDTYSLISILSPIDR